jgi:hypothetical protein
MCDPTDHASPNGIAQWNRRTLKGRLVHPPALERIGRQPMGFNQEFTRPGFRNRQVDQ